MKRISFFLLALFAIFSLSACSSGISQADYDNLLNENSALQSEKESLLSENESLVSENKSLSDYKKEQPLNDTNTIYIEAWANISFGENSTYLFDENSSHFQCIAEKTYPISTEGITELWSDFTESLPTLGMVKDSYSDFINYETISVRYLDPNDTYLLDIILKKSEETYILDAITCNVLYTTTIIPVLNSQIN